jgi:hypothetical protein
MLFSTFKKFIFEKRNFFGFGFGFINRFFRVFGFVFGFVSVQPKPNRKTDFFRFPVTGSDTRSISSHICLIKAQSVFYQCRSYGTDSFSVCQGAGATQETLYYVSK